MRSFNSALGSALLGISLIAILLSAALQLRLITKHRAYWRSLGSPILRLPRLSQRQYDELGDPIASRLARIVKVLVVVFFGGVAVSLALTYLVPHETR